MFVWTLIRFLSKYNYWQDLRPEKLEKAFYCTFDEEYALEKDEYLFVKLIPYQTIF